MVNHDSACPTPFIDMLLWIATILIHKAFLFLPVSHLVSRQIPRVKRLIGHINIFAQRYITERFEQITQFRFGLLFQRQRVTKTG